MPIQLFIAIGASIAATVFWLVFFYYYSPRLTTPRGTLALLLVGGAFVAGSVFFLERWVFSFFPPGLSFLLGQGRITAEGPWEIFLVGFVMFAIVAPIEESVKFFLLRLHIRLRGREWNQIIDGIKFGLVVGLGFAAVENAIYFYFALPSGSGFHVGWLGFAPFLKIFFLRFFTATLAHALYSGMMGYFIGLSRFHRLYANRFLRRALVFPVILHGLYNTFLFTSVNFYSTVLIIIFLLVLLKWYSDRKNLEIRVERGETEVILPPFLSDRPEFESVLSKGRASYDLIKKLRLCPFCLARDTFQANLCTRCGRRMKKRGDANPFIIRPGEYPKD